MEACRSARRPGRGRDFAAERLDHSAGVQNFRQTGLGTLIECPVVVSAPLVGSIRKTTTLSRSWLATSRNCPLGSMAKLRGFLIPSAWCLAWRACRLGIDLITDDAVVPAVRAEQETGPRDGPGRRPDSCPPVAFGKAGEASGSP